MSRVAGIRSSGLIGRRVIGRERLAAKKRCKRTLGPLKRGESPRHLKRDSVESDKEQCEDTLDVAQSNADPKLKFDKPVCARDMIAGARETLCLIRLRVSGPAENYRGPIIG